MSTFVFYASLIGIGLVLLGLIPGVRELLSPVLKSLTSFAVFIFSEGGTWAWFVVKLIISSHLTFIRHLITAPEKIDPTLMVRDETDK